jgi:hypothetical protein
MSKKEQIPLFKPEDMASAVATHFNYLVKNDNKIRTLLENAAKKGESTYIIIMSSLIAFYFQTYINCLAEQVNNDDKLVLPFIEKAGFHIVSIINEVNSNLGYGAIGSEKWMAYFYKNWFDKPSGAVADWIQENYKLLQFEAYEDENPLSQRILRLIAPISIHSGISPRKNLFEFMPLFVSLSSTGMEAEDMIRKGYENDMFVFDVSN